MDTVVLKNYIDLYNRGVTLDKIKPLNNQTYRIFRSSSAGVRIVDRRETYKNSMAYSRIANFLIDKEYFYMIPVTTPKGTIVGFLLRGLFSSKYSTVSRTFDNLENRVPLMFGFNKQFLKYDKGKKCYPIIVCEGCKDCLALKKIYPYVLANNTSSMGINLHILRNISNKFLLAYDNDEAGLDGMKRDKKILRENGAYVDTLQLPDYVVNLKGEEKKCKDCADCIEDNKAFKKLSEQIKYKLKCLYEI